MKIQDIKNWEKAYQKMIIDKNYPSWPSEIMLKILNGSYSKTKNLKINKNTKVLDVGCGFGNNLLPFLKKKAKCFGTEISPLICKITTKILKKEKYKNFKIISGNNTRLPFKNSFFDLVLSNSVLHYEQSKINHLKALKEYGRVLKKRGKLFIITTAPKHELVKISNRTDKKTKDFRKGQIFFFLRSELQLKKNLSITFKKIETGRVTESFNKRKYDVFLAICSKK
jgi:ubiquinone/menaquinone biosynthesis C-methylase UbiE